MTTTTYNRAQRKALEVLASDERHLAGLRKLLALADELHLQAEADSLRESVGDMENEVDADMELVAALGLGPDDAEAYYEIDADDADAAMHCSVPGSHHCPPVAHTHEGAHVLVRGGVRFYWSASMGRWVTLGEAE